MVTYTFSWKRTVLLIGTAVAISACATGPQITRTQELSESTDAPYRNILIIGLFASYDARKNLEREVVRQLADLGTKAVASTSSMDTKTPVTRETILALVETLNADAVLVTQIASAESETAVIDRNPQATYNVRPTYYYNVWNVELTEYIEPPGIEVKSSLVLATQMYSALTQEPIWAIESKTTIVRDASQPRHYPFIEGEVRAIVGYLSSDGLIASQ